MQACNYKIINNSNCCLIFVKQLYIKSAGRKIFVMRYAQKHALYIKNLMHRASTHPKGAWITASSSPDSTVTHNFEKHKIMNIM